MQMDTDGDGSMSKAEFQKVLGAEELEAQMTVEVNV